MQSVQWTVMQTLHRKQINRELGIYGKVTVRKVTILHISEMTIKYL